MGDDGETLVAGWLIFKQEYQFTYLDRVSIDSSRENRLAISIRKTDPSDYPVVGTLQADAFFADGSPLPEASTLSFDAYGSQGTHIDLQDDSGDCLVVLWVRPAAGDDFVAMARAVNLSGPSAVELDFREPSDGFAEVQATASQGGNQASCFFSTPYGLIPGWFRSSDAEPRMSQSWEFASALPEQVPACNPFACVQDRGLRLHRPGSRGLGVGVTGRRRRLVSVRAHRGGRPEPHRGHRLRSRRV